MKSSASVVSAAALPAGGPLLLIVGYVAIVALFRRSGLFDFTYHAIVLVLMGFAIAGHTPFQEIATAMLTTMLIATVVSYMFSEGKRDPRGQHPRKFSGPVVTYQRGTTPGVTAK